MHRRRRRPPPTPPKKKNKKQKTKNKTKTKKKQQVKKEEGTWTPTEVVVPPAGFLGYTMQKDSFEDSFVNHLSVKLISSIKIIITIIIIKT